MAQYVYFFGGGKADGNKDMKDTLGGKGAGLADMTNAGLTPFRLLQSLESPQVGFLVLEASALVGNYCEVVPAREWETVGVTGKTKPLAFVIVVIGSTPQSSTGNFQAPLLVNYDKMIGKQIILTDSGFSVRQALV